jgi:hypothetical protein
MLRRSSDSPSVFEINRFSETHPLKRRVVLIGSLALTFAFEIIASQFGRSQDAHPQAEPYAPVAPVLLPDRPALRLMLIAPTLSRCPCHPQSAQTEVRSCALFLVLQAGHS